MPRTVAFLTLAAALLVGHALAESPVVAPAMHESVQVPVWTAANATANPGCVAAAAWPPGTPAAAVIVYGGNRDERGARMPFDTAWRLNHDLTEVNDVWVIGICR